MAYLGSDPVGRMQENIVRTLSGGLSNLGNRGLQKAQMGLQEAQIRHTIGRQGEVDRQRNLEFEQGQEAYLRNEAEMNKPVYLTDAIQGFFGKPEEPGDADYGPGGLLGSKKAPSRETMMHVVGNGWMPEAFKMSGIKLGAKDATGHNPLVRADGSPVTRRDGPKIGLVMQAAVLSKMDAGHTWDQRAREINKNANPTKQEKAWLKQYNEKKPERMIAAYQDQIKKIEGLYGPLAESGVKDFGLLDRGITRATGKIAKQERILATASDRAFQIKLKRIGIDAKKKDGKAAIGLPDGSKLTVSDARGLYRDFYNIPNENTLDEMAYSDDPKMVTSAARFRELLNEKDMIKFFKRLQDEGLPQNWGDADNANPAPDWRMYQNRGAE